jgi:hypothetical protein
MVVSVYKAPASATEAGHAAWAYRNNHLYVMPNGHHFELYRAAFPEEADDLLWSQDPKDVIAGDTYLGRTRVFHPDSGETMPLSGLEPDVAAHYFGNNYDAIKNHLQRYTKDAARQWQIYTPAEDQFPELDKPRGKYGHPIIVFPDEKGVVVGPLGTHHTDVMKWASDYFDEDYLWRGGETLWLNAWPPKEDAGNVRPYDGKPVPPEAQELLKKQFPDYLHSYKTTYE